MLFRYASVLVLATASVVGAGTGAVRIWSSYEALLVEQRPLMPLAAAESRGPRGRWEATSEDGAQVAGRLQLEEWAANAAMLCGADREVFFRLIKRESEWNPKALSASGAMGLTQVKPAAAAAVSVGLDPSDVWQNLVAGACYLRQQYDSKRGQKSWKRALILYHLGPNHITETRSAQKYADSILTGTAYGN